MTISRRDFLLNSTAAAVGLSASPVLASTRDVNCIFLTLVGGPSQLDTWDPKPDAPSEVRSPFRPIQTRIPGVLFSELFPKMAAYADQFTIVRSMHHTASPIHETGLQLMQTGLLPLDGTEAPHFGAVVSARKGDRGSTANVLLPGPIGFTGLNVSHGQTAGSLGTAHEPVSVEIDVSREPLRDSYGRTGFGDNCMRAARLIERGSRFVTVNMFQSVYDTITWDCHAAGGSLRSELSHYPSIAASFDNAYTALLGDLRQSGLLDSTLVVATGEFGRTPYLNRDGGRDHWAGVWTILLAGGGISSGQVIGSSCRIGAEPKDSPVDPSQFATTMQKVLGLPSNNGSSIFA